MPFRAKLRSITAPVVPSPSSHPAPNALRSVSNGVIRTQVETQPPQETTPTEASPASSDQSIPPDQDHLRDTSDITHHRATDLGKPLTGSIDTAPVEKLSTNTDTMADNHSVPSLSSQSTSPDPTPSSSPHHPAASCDVEGSPTQETPHQLDHNQDQIQPWQTPFNHSSFALDHSSLERANSAAARLDSLARLNGVKNPDSSHSAHNLDLLPPFLMAKHIEETKKRVELGQTLTALPHANYPLPLPASLGFSVGPNGRGVPRLSALQRKALEKIANQQGTSDISTAAKSLTRSHTTTGTESPQHRTNRIQPLATDESQERQQARSNLIRKLSSRGAHSRPKLPVQSPPPSQLLTSPQETANETPLCYTPELVPSLEHPPARSASRQDPTVSTQPVSLSHSFIPPTSAVHSFDLKQVEPSQLSADLNSSLDVNLKPESEPVISSQQTCISNEPIDRQVDASDMIPDAADHSATPRPSLNLLDNHTHSGQPIQVASKNVDVDPLDTYTPISPQSFVYQPPTQHVFTATNLDSSDSPTPRSSPPEHGPSVAQLQPSSSLSDSQSARTSGLAEFFDADTDPRPSGSDRLNPSADPFPTSGITTQLLHPASCSSARSSIVERLKAKASLSSRIERSLASGRSTPPTQRNSLQSSVRHSVESQTDRRRSSNAGTTRVSRPSYPSTPQRFRHVANDTSEEHAGKLVGGMNRSGATSPSKPFYHDRALRPTRAPPIAEAHNVVGRGLKTGGDLGPSQFPPTPHLVRTHMPVASAVDLARYNDQKLAPFPGLLNTSPPSSPERSRSPRSSSKTLKSTNGILTSASNFFRSPGRRSREESLSSEMHTANVSSTKHMETRLSPKYSTHMSQSNDEEKEEVVDSSRWQSMGDAAEKISSPTPMSRSSTDDSHLSSVSMISNQRRKQILARLSPFLKSPAHSQQNSRLHDPPRKLLWHQPVLQVANSASFKDRYLFVFNDILVITKPLLEFEDRNGERVPKLPITLEQSFLTKSVVELKALRFISSGPLEQAVSSRVDLRFNEAFQIDPSQAIQSYLDGANFPNQEYEVAKLLLSTHELDKRQLGQYLSGPENTNILRSYLDQLNFAFMRLEDALRTVLLSLRLPADPGAINRFLEQFGAAWTRCNPKVCLSAALATRWATATIVISEHLHDGLTDSMRYVAGLIGLTDNKLKTEAQFVEMIKGNFDSVEGKLSTALPAEKLDAMLKRAYQSIRRDRLVQARANVEDTEKIQLSTEGGRLYLPSQLTYQVASELITITIPKPDSQLGIKLFGPGLSFEPSLLRFSQSRTASFSIVGKAIGMRQISFVKIGRRAAAYEGLPLNLAVSVERAFMQHTVQVGFYNHLSAKRKYLLSFHDSEPKEKFTQLITRAQNEARLKPTQGEVPNGPQAMGKMVALQVLRDTLILNEDLLPMNVNPYASTTVVLTAGNKKSKTTSKDNPHQQEGNNNNVKPHKIRSNSLSETYIHTVGKNEKDLQQAIIDRRNQAQEMHIRNKQQTLLKERLTTNLEGGRMDLNPYSFSNKESPIGIADENQNSFFVSKFAKSGTHLIQHCEQNSLIPLVLGFLSMGAIEKGRIPPNLNKFSSQGNLRGNTISPIGQNYVDNDKIDHDEGNKTIRKQTSHIENRVVYPNHPHPHTLTPSASSIFARFSPK